MVIDAKEQQHITVFVSNINKSKNQFQIRKKFIENEIGRVTKIKFRIPFFLNALTHILTIKVRQRIILIIH